MDKLREEEKHWFGSSTDGKTDASRVRIRLDDWRGATLSSQDFAECDFPSVRHPEVGRNVSAALYLGYGPVTWSNAEKRAEMARNSALSPREVKKLRLSYPVHLEDEMDRSLQLVALFGCLGSRCRNGWGSLAVRKIDADGRRESLVEESIFDHSDKESRNWLRAMAVGLSNALQQDWCHALGKDSEKLLMWRTEEFDAWEKVLGKLAEAKVDLRTNLPFKTGGSQEELSDRHLLAYPVTNHELKAWGKNARSANQLLFKVHALNKGYVGLVAHFPHSLPTPLRRKLQSPPSAAEETDVWRRVHDRLDKKLIRLP